MLEEAAKRSNIIRHTKMLGKNVTPKSNILRYEQPFDRLVAASNTMSDQNVSSFSQGLKTKRDVALIFYNTAMFSVNQLLYRSFPFFSCPTELNPT